MTRTLAALALAVLLRPLASAGEPASGAAPVYGYRVVRVYPHDRSAFTQGLEFREGFLYEGTGLEGRSSVRKVDLASGRVVRQVDLAPSLFGEGITVLRGKVVELTWQTRLGFVYDLPTFRLLASFRYPGEGWGLTNDGRRIYMSDGSAEIRRWNPDTFAEEGRIAVHEGGRAVPDLNELEWVRGEIYANVWQTDRIARISPNDGRVLGWVDLAGLLPRADRALPVDVLNGIAYDSAGDRLFVTGKLWPKLFEIRVVKR